MKNANILVPFDFSGLSRRTLQTANQWVRLFGGSVTPIHTYEAVTDLDGFYFYGPKESVAGVSVKPSVLQAEGSAHQGIYRFLQDNKCNLIVTAAAGKSRIEQLLLGSTTAQVAREANTNLFLVAPEYQGDLHLENIENYFKV